MRRILIHWVLPVVLLALVVNFLLGLRAESQIRSKQEEFWVAIEQNKKARLLDLISDAYADRWGFTKEAASEQLSEVSGHFFNMDIAQEEDAVAVEGDTATFTAKLRVKGTGDPISTEVISRINRISEPWVFHWRKESGAPWSWRLVRVEHPTFEAR